jgi:hypothetical protein
MSETPTPGGGETNNPQNESYFSPTQARFFKYVEDHLPPVVEGHEADDRNAEFNIDTNLFPQLNGGNRFMVEATERSDVPPVQDTRYRTISIVDTEVVDIPPNKNAPELEAIGMSFEGLEPTPRNVAHVFLAESPDEFPYITVTVGVDDNYPLTGEQAERYTERLLNGLEHMESLGGVRPSQ